MYESQTFETILSRMLQNVKDDLDKREGSVIYTALAPIALELETYYEALDEILNEVFADTADYYYLCKRAAERDIYPVEATAAILRMVADPSTANIEVGDKFTSEDYELTFEVISGDDVEGAYNIICDTPGTEGNIPSGVLIPVEEISGLESAYIQGAVAYDNENNKILDEDGNETYQSAILRAGTDEEDVETFRARYFASIKTKAFGGNKEDYINKIKENPNIGACKVKRAWNIYSPNDLVPTPAVENWFDTYAKSDLESHSLEGNAEIWSWLESVYTIAKNKLLVTGGTVEVFILDSTYNIPNEALINELKNVLDPTNGNGDGIVPIGHVVNVKSAVASKISLNLTLSYKSGYSIDDIKEKVRSAAEQLAADKRSEWEATDGIQLSSIQFLMAIYNEISPYVSNISDCTAYSSTISKTVNLMYELGEIDHTSGSYYNEDSLTAVRTPLDTVVDLSPYEDVEFTVTEETLAKYKVIIWLCDSTGTKAVDNQHGAHKYEFTTAKSIKKSDYLSDYIRIEVKARNPSTFVQSEAEDAVSVLVANAPLAAEEIPVIDTIEINGEVI